MGQIISVGVKFLDAGILRIRDINIIGAVHRHASGIRKLAIARTMLTAMNQVDQTAPRKQ